MCAVLEGGEEREEEEEREEGEEGEEEEEEEEEEELLKDVFCPALSPTTHWSICCSLSYKTAEKLRKDPSLELWRDRAVEVDHWVVGRRTREDGKKTRMRARSISGS